MIKYINDEKDVIDFILEMLDDEYFSNPMLKTKEQLIYNLFRPIIDPNDFVIATYTDDVLTGVFSCIVEPEEKYLELLLAYSKKKESYLEFMDFIYKNYQGYNCDFLLNPNNKIFLNILKEYNGIFEPVQKYMVLDHINEYESCHNIVFYNEKYKDQYLDLHIKDIYWTGEKVLEANDRFKILLAIDNDDVVGYVDYTYVYNNNEPYTIFVKEEYRNKGYGTALMYKAIIDNYPKNMSLRVDFDNINAIHVYEKLGFIKDESNDSILISLKIKKEV